MVLKYVKSVTIVMLLLPWPLGVTSWSHFSGTNSIYIYKWRKRQRQGVGREKAHAFVESARLKFVGQMYGQATQDGYSLVLCTSLARPVPISPVSSSSD